MVLFGRDWFEGGFLGVDIFFVISGYLITRIILNELSETNTFSFVNFYERRLRRILPMLFFIIAVCLPYAWQKLLPMDLVDFSKSAMSALAFGSNFFFYFSTTEYGADSALLKPLLHTWSLGVEEQFYAIAPMLLLLGWKWRGKNSLLAILLVMFLLSIWFADWMSERNAGLNFYLPFSRFWELLTGSVIAFVEIKYGIRKSPILSQTLPLLGLFLVVYSILFFGSSIPHPSFFSLMPIVGVALIIAFCSKDDLVGSVLSSRPFVGVGLISYSMYLWHFPIFAFSRMGGNKLLNYDKLELIFATVILSVLTYVFVEKPFRNRQRVNQKLFCGVLATSFFILLTVNYDFVKKDGYLNRLPPVLFVAELDEYVWDLYKQDGKPCYSRQKDFCSISNGNSNTTVYAFGDSHFSAMSPQLASVITLGKKFNYLEINEPGCPFVLNMDRYTLDGNKDEGCTADFQRLRNSKIATQPSIILVGGRFPLYLSGLLFDNKEGGVEEEGNKLFPDGKWKHFRSLSGRKFEDEFVDTVKLLLEKGHYIVFIYPIPEVGLDVPKFIFNKINKAKESYDISKAQNIMEFEPMTTSYDVYNERVKNTFELFDSINSDNIYRVYPHTLFCDNQIKGRCVTHDKSHIYYFDDDHPRDKGSEMIVELIMEKVEEAERKIRDDS